MGDKNFKGKISAKGTEITVLSKGNDDDFISLADIARYKNTTFPSEVIQNWMRNRSTVEYLGLWERIHNPDFNYLEFEAIDRDAGRNAFVLTPKHWVKTINAIGMTTKQGRYAATYAHKDIAFKFASWISAEFELIGKGLSQTERIEELNKLARSQIASLLSNSGVKRLKELDGGENGGQRGEDER